MKATVQTNHIRRVCFPGATKTSGSFGSLTKTVPFCILFHIYTRVGLVINDLRQRLKLSSHNLNKTNNEVPKKSPAIVLPYAETIAIYDIA